MKDTDTGAGLIDDIIKELKCWKKKKKKKIAASIEKDALLISLIHIVVHNNMEF